MSARMKNPAMRDKTFKNDMTMMYAIHDALRRELEHLAGITARASDDPQRILRTAVGWELFKAYLHIHHTAEDETLWPVLRQSLADRPDDLALLDAMEAEHATIDPLLTSIDAALVDRDAGPQRLGDLVDALVTGLTGHLKHEEDEALELIDTTATVQQFQVFGLEHGKRLTYDMSRYVPWLLDGVSAETTAAVLGLLPEPVRLAYRNEWRSAFAGLARWDVR